jgi:hypothetical protein
MVWKPTPKEDWDDDTKRVCETLAELASVGGKMTFGLLERACGFQHAKVFHKLNGMLGAITEYEARELRRPMLSALLVDKTGRTPDGFFNWA